MAATQPKPARAQCRVLSAKNERCTGEALDPDAKAIQVCARHAAEVMQLINDRKKATRK